MQARLPPELLNAVEVDDLFDVLHPVLCLGGERGGRDAGGGCERCGWGAIPLAFRLGRIEPERPSIVKRMLKLRQT